MENYEIIRVDENTWRIEDRGVRFFLLAGKEKALMIDSGMTLTNARDIAQELTDLPLELIITHGDRDHIAGNCGFDWFYMHPSEASNYYNNQPGTGKFRPVFDGDVLDLGDRKLEIIALPGHTPGSIALLDQKHRKLFSGDPVQDGMIFMFGVQREMHAYICGLRRLETRLAEFNAVYPAHGSCPVASTMVSILAERAEGILAGKFTPEAAEMFGTPIAKYNVGEAIFLCEPK